MNASTGRDRLEEGDWQIREKRPVWDKRKRYLDGDHDLPYAPDGVNEEYEALRIQAIQNWLGIAMTAPIQDMRAGGFRSGKNADADDRTWEIAWQGNHMDSRQAVVYEDMIVQERGIVSVWLPDEITPNVPKIRPESGRDVHIQGDEEDPWTQKWAVKRIDRAPLRPRIKSTLWVPESVEVEKPDTVQIGWVHDRDSWQRWERRRRDSAFGAVNGEWELVKEGTHNLGGVPFVPYDYRPTSGAKPRSGIDQLIPAQDAINTIRFNILLAMQFAAFRQRGVTGFDPVLRDAEGQPVYRKNPDGTDFVDGNGVKVPIIVSPGRAGVDRLLVFPGADTKVWDLAESDLSNYNVILVSFLAQFFGTAQIPPQYMVAGGMSNVNGDAFTAANQTLRSLRNTLKLSAGESNEVVMRMGTRALGLSEDEPGLASETIWDQDEARSFGQIVDAISKLITSGMDPIDAWAMLPGATQQLLRQWKDNSEKRLQRMIELSNSGLGAPAPGAGIPRPSGGAQPGPNGGRAASRSGGDGL